PVARTRLVRSSFYCLFKMVGRDSHTLVEVQPVRVLTFGLDARIEMELIAAQPPSLLQHPVNKGARVATTTIVGPCRKVVAIEGVPPNQGMNSAEPGDFGSLLVSLRKAG